MILAWKAERRQSVEAKFKAQEFILKIAQLELQVAEARTKAGAEGTDAGALPIRDGNDENPDKIPN